MAKTKKEDSKVEAPKETKEENKNTPPKERDYSELIKQVKSEYKLAYDFMKPKIEEWALRLKLYNNQKRDKEAIGDPLMFTLHQTVLASLYSDQLMVEFEGREEGDEDTAESLDNLAKYDEDDMEKDIVDYEWDWDASFFGRGLLLFMEYDRKTYTPIPEVIDPMTWLRDENAKSINGDRRGRGAMRYGGREIRLTENEMRSAGVYFNFDDLKDNGKDAESLTDRNSELRTEAQGLGSISRKGVDGENKDFKVLEWFTTYGGKKVLVGLAEGRSQVIRYTELDSNRWPIIDRPIYPMAHDWDGVSIPDLTEDKQRARSVMQNLGMKGVKAGLHPMYLYNTNKIKNRADLNFEFNKFVGVDGEPSGAVAPMQTKTVQAEVKWIFDILDTAAQRATSSPEIQQGVQSDDKRTLGEIQLVSSKADTRYSLSAKIFGWSEKRFWRQWYKLYKKHFKDKIDEKSIRINGAMGTQWRKLTRENIIMVTDPDVAIESKIISDQKRLIKLNIFRAYVKDVIATSGNSANLRFALKKLGKLSGLTKDEIDRLLPPNTDELISQEENGRLDNNKL
ncbi:hypothetical protein KJ912_00770, partial [Patescibacteria group bacterium]|nr:hypothetical protein [Patescibacteria group bacterium]